MGIAASEGGSVSTGPAPIAPKRDSGTDAGRMRNAQGPGTRAERRNARTANYMAGVSIEIGELVVHGFPPETRERIAKTMHGELGRLIARSGRQLMRARNSDEMMLGGGDFAVPHGSTPEQAGLHIARALFRGLTGQ